MSKGRSIRLFLVDGTSNGLLTAEIVNWTGHVLTAQRSKLSQLIAREECGRTVVYFLIGNDPEDPYRPWLYIGESDDISARLKQHNRPEDKGGKDFWEKVCLVTSKDQNLTKSHIRYLEAELIELARSAAACHLQNTSMPTYGTLPESDVSDMRFFIQQIKTILPVLGFNFLQDARRTRVQPEEFNAVKESPTFELSLTRDKITAHAKEIDGEFIVQKGSSVRKQWSGSHHKSYESLYADLIELGVIVEDADGQRYFNEDYAFRSPSAAAAIVTGRTANGRLEWKEQGTQQTYAQWQEAQIEKVIEGSHELSQGT